MMLREQARKALIDALVEDAVTNIALDHSYLAGILREGLQGLNDMSDAELIENVEGAELLHDDREIMAAVNRLRDEETA